jgi:PST family polysaccharide transporter
VSGSTRAGPAGRGPAGWRTAAAGVAWGISTSVAARGLSLIGTLVMIRFVAPYDYGEASVATVVVATLNQLTTLGVGIYAVAKRDATREDLFHATLIHVLMGLVAFAILLIVPGQLESLFDAPNFSRYVPGLAAASLMDRFALMPERVLIRDLRFRHVSIIRSLGELAYTVASVGAAAAGWGGMSIVFGNVVRSGLRGLAMIGSVRLADWAQVTRVRLAILLKIARYGLNVTFAGLAMFASRRWDNLLVSRYFGPTVMGTYNLAYNLADTPATYIGEQITDVMEATFAHMQPDERRQTLLRSLGVIGLITFPIAVGLGAIAPTLADLFLNKRWAGAGPMLLILAMLSVVRPMFGAVWAFIVVERGPRPLMIIEWLNLALLMGLLATLGRISPLWACGSVGIAFTIRSVFGLYLVRETAEISILRQLAQLMPPLLACVPMAGAVFGVRWAMVRVGVTAPVVHIGVEVLLGAAVFIGSALLVARRPAQELVTLVRRRGSRRSTTAVGTAATEISTAPAPVVEE